MTHHWTKNLEFKSVYTSNLIKKLSIYKVDSRKFFSKGTNIYNFSRRLNIRYFTKDHFSKNIQRVIVIIIKNMN